MQCNEMKWNGMDGVLDGKAIKCKSHKSNHHSAILLSLARMICWRQREGEWEARKGAMHSAVCAFEWVIDSIIEVIGYYDFERNCLIDKKFEGIFHCDLNFTQTHTHKRKNSMVMGMWGKNDFRFDLSAPKDAHCSAMTTLNQSVLHSPVSIQSMNYFYNRHFDSSSKIGFSQWHWFTTIRQVSSLLLPLPSPSLLQMKWFYRRLYDWRQEREREKKNQDNLKTFSTQFKYQSLSIVGWLKKIEVRVMALNKLTV